MVAETLIEDAQDFLARLAANNNRDWFTAHKPEYEARLKAPALALLGALSPDLAQATGAPVATKLFRPNRDIRFSKDRTLYNTHLHMVWSIETGGRQHPAYFFGIAPDYMTVGAGLMEFDRPVLEDWRRMLDLDGPRICGILTAAEVAGFTLREPELKRVPQPYAADHPQADLLRRKSCVAWGPLPGDGPPLPRLRAALADLAPVLRTLGGIA